MSDTGKDTARQVATVVGALFQVLVGYGGIALLGLDVGQVSRENSTLVVPAGYAFTIWGVIFVLSLAYAVYQALPANRENLLLRRVGWFLAGTFACNGLWEIVFPARQFLLAQALILGSFVFLAVAYLRLVRFARSRGTSGAERWLVALPLGLHFGWVTAATFVSFATTSVALGLLGGGLGEALLGAILLLLGGTLASAAITLANSGPPQSYLAYAAAILWALFAVVVNQYDDSIITTGAAVIAGALVVSVLLKALRGSSSGEDTGRIAKPGTA